MDVNLSLIHISFGAIFEISQVFDVLHRIRKGEQVVAIVAPVSYTHLDVYKRQLYIGRAEYRPAPA